MREIGRYALLAAFVVSCGGEIDAVPPVPPPPPPAAPVMEPAAAAVTPVAVSPAEHAPDALKGLRFYVKGEVDEHGARVEKSDAASDLGPSTEMALQEAGFTTVHFGDPNDVVVTLWIEASGAGGTPARRELRLTSSGKPIQVFAWKESEGCQRNREMDAQINATLGPLERAKKVAELMGARQPCSPVTDDIHQRVGQLTHSDALLAVAQAPHDSTSKTPPPGGRPCKKDVDCSGDDVCEKHVCVTTAGK